MTVFSRTSPPVSTDRAARLRILGVDGSLTSSGLAYRSPGEPVILHRVRQPKLRGHERLHEILATVMSYAEESDVVIMEGLAYGAVGSSLLELAGLSCLIGHRLWEEKIPLAVISPMTRAKWLTGRGNAPKDECLAEAIKRFGTVTDEITGNDVADALTLMAMGCDYYGDPLVTMPADRRPLLHATKTAKGHKGEPVIDWPALRPALRPALGR